jgi:hypothetical protein
MRGLRGALCCIAATLLTPGIWAQVEYTHSSHDRASWIESPEDRAAAFSPAVESRVAAITTESGAALIAEATAIRSDDSFDYRAKDRLLFEVISRMGALPEAVGERETLESLTSWTSEFVYMEPACRTEIAQPVFPVAAAARQLLNERARGTARERAMELVEAGQFSALLDEAASFDAPRAEGNLDALMTAIQSDKLADALLDASPETLKAEPISRLLLATATAQNSPPMFGKLVRHGDERVAISGIATAPQVLDETSAVGVLIMAATDRSELASSALLELGRSAPNNERARAFLVSLLGNERYGGSVAQAFAESGNRELLEALGQNLQTETDQMVQARLALAMHLWGDPAGNAALAAFVERADVDAVLRGKVSQWVVRQ